MIDTKKFIKFLKRKNINFFTGVPDSLLKSFSKELETTSHKNNIIAANEGAAVSLGLGYFLATKKIPCVYMQNSGLGNAINPLASLVHEKVYSIPMLLIIGWRGGPSHSDEPQHEVKGKITLKLLKLLKIKYLILNENKKKFDEISKLISFSKKFSKPVAIVVKKNTFLSKKSRTLISKNKSILRGEIIEILLNKLDKKSKIISTTGYTSRELHQIRLQKKNKNGKDFYLVGGMGHAASVAVGVANKKKEKVICLDGDGSLIMHMGSLATIGFFRNKNFIHFLFNNGVHESVGAQKVFSDQINFKNLILSLGYKNYYFFDNKNHFKEKIATILKTKGPVFINIKTKIGAIKNLSRPKNLKEIKNNFLK